MRQFGSRMYLRMRSRPLPAIVVQPLHTVASDPQGDLPSSVQLAKPDRAKACVWLAVSGFHLPLLTPGFSYVLRSVNGQTLLLGSALPWSEAERGGEGDGVPARAAQGAGGARSAPGHLRPPHPQQRPLRRPPPRTAGKLHAAPPASILLNRKPKSKGRTATGWTSAVALFPARTLYLDLDLSWLRGHHAGIKLPSAHRTPSPPWASACLAGRVCPSSTNYHYHEHD